MKGNSIRCCLCTSKQPSSKDCFDLLMALDAAGCRYNVGISGRVVGYMPSTDQDLRIVEPTLDTHPNQQKLSLLADWMTKTQYLLIDCGWHTTNGIYESVLALLHLPIEDECVRFTYSVPDTVFLPGIQNSPDGTTPCFAEFKHIIVKLIEFLKPTAAVIDYEADLLCEELSDAASRVGWGSFVPISIFNDLSDWDQQTLLNLADDCTNVGDRGYLLFINPLTANEARTAKHDELEQLINRLLHRNNE